MVTTQFNRDALARWYAKQHLMTDPGIRSIYYLPGDSPEREVRLLEVNELIGELDDAAIEPIDYGVDSGSENMHRLFVMDVTPQQWERIEAATMRLPAGWTLEGRVEFHRKSK
ncbi:MAG: hypothetical protein KF708_12220 [Pirellulales bacterium]|nr:hypothetical protein [Pirellulales bacterium]